MDDVTPRLHHTAATTTVLLCLAALICAGCGSKDDATGDATTQPAWRADTSAPALSVASDPKGPVISDQSGPVANLGLRWSSDYGELEGEAGCAAAGICLSTATHALADWSHETEREGPEVRHTFSARQEGTHANLEAVWTLVEGDPRVRLALKLIYTSDAAPDREAVTLELMDPASVLGRDMRFAGLVRSKPIHLSSLTPHRVIAGEGPRALHLVANGFQGMEALRGETTRLTFELDDARNHPFRPTSGCGTPAAAPTALDRFARKAGDAVTGEIELWFGHTWAPIPHRYPKGYEAAVALLDTTPNPSQKALTALLWGHSDSNDPRYGNGGLLGHRIPMTQALYGGPRGYGDPEISSIARQATELGVRFADAGPTRETDGEELVSVSRSNFSALGSKVSAGPARDGDCDVPTADGWRTPAEKALLVHQPSVEAKPSLGNMNVLRSRQPTIYRHTRLGADVTLFNTWDLTGDNAWRHIQLSNLERLAEARGLTLAEVRLARRSFGGGLRLERGANVVPMGELETRLFELSDLRERRRVWTVTVDDLIDHLSALETLDIEPMADGTYSISHDSPAPLPITLILPGQSYRARVNGADLPVSVETRTDKNSKPAQHSAMTWLELPPRAATIVEIVDGEGRHIQPLVPVRWTVK